MVRAYDRLHMIELDGLDLAFAERELFESAVAMGRSALKASGIGQEEVDRVDRAYRARDCERLELQSSSGDLHAGPSGRSEPTMRCPTRKSKARPRPRHRSGDFERLDDGFDDIAMCSVAASYMDVSLLV